MNTPDPPHWNLNSCIGAFWSILVHFGLYRYCMKVDAKHAEMVELMHKFVPQSRIRIIQNECTRSTQLNPKAMFGAFRSVWVHLAMFRTRNSVQNGFK